MQCGGTLGIHKMVWKLWITFKFESTLFWLLIFAKSTCQSQLLSYSANVQTNTGETTLPSCGEFSYYYKSVSILVPRITV